MRPRQKVTRAGIQLIAAFEGLRRRAARLPDGRWTIGYGHTLSAREGAEVSQEDAEALLHFDLLPIAEAVNSLVYTPLTQNQFDALVAFAYNVGVEQFRASDVLKRVNEGRLTEAACAIDLWRKADLNGDSVILDALIRRRAAEKALFLTPPDGFVPTPSPLVRPAVDTDLAPALSQSRPAEIAVPMEGPLAEIVRVPPPEPPVSEEPLEFTTSEAETQEVQPQESVAVEASYSPELPAEAVHTLSVEELEAGEPGAEAIASEPAAEAEAPPEPAVETSVQEPALEPEPQPTFPVPPPVEAMEPAVEVAPEAFPEPAPEPVEEPHVEAVPLAAPPPERIYAPEPAVEPEPPTPIAEGGYPQGPGQLGFETPAVTTESAPPPSVWTLTPPPEVIETPPSRIELAPERVAERNRDDQTPLFEAVEQAVEQDVAQRIIRHEEVEGEEGTLDRPSNGPFILMGVIGLAALGGAMTAFMKARAGIAGIENLTLTAWTLALIGACCVGTAVYFLLKRLGGVED